MYFLKKIYLLFWIFKSKIRVIFEILKKNIDGGQNRYGGGGRNCPLSFIFLCKDDTHFGIGGRN